jgi:plasmid stabilization system protein ParE
MVKLSPVAAQDIDDILGRSISEFGIEQTEIYYDLLARCLELLVADPSLGHAADDIRAGYRRIPHESHASSSTRSNGLKYSSFAYCTSEWTLCETFRNEQPVDPRKSS